MDLEEPLARRATDLLLQIKAGRADAEQAVNQYDELLFPVLRNVALRRGRFMTISASGAVGVRPPDVRPADLEAVAGDAARLALLRARSSALRFDPERGDGASWALRALGAAYLDEARSATRSRRLLGEVPLEPEWVEHPSLTRDDGDPEYVAEVRDRLERVLETLTDDERFVVIARHYYGLSYREIAGLRFGDDTKIKLVDRTLQSALGRLRAADAESTDES